VCRVPLRGVREVYNGASEWWIADAACMRKSPKCALSTIAAALVRLSALGDGALEEGFWTLGHRLL
jgi:hypothetical protein